MPCTPIDLGNGVTAIVCTRGQRSKRCKECGARASILCDYPLRGKAAGRTCDAALCTRCAVNVGRDRDYCGPHARIAQRAPQSEQLDLLGDRP